MPRSSHLDPLLTAPYRPLSEPGLSLGHRCAAALARLKRLLRGWLRPRGDFA